MMKRKAPLLPFQNRTLVMLVVLEIIFLGYVSVGVIAQCTTCPDQSQCCNGAICCRDGPSYGCCPAGGTCCNDTCCDSTETCCKGTCCIKQTTFCCPAVAQHPDRCCPRWTVCCPGGQYVNDSHAVCYCCKSDGCCTPFEAREYIKQKKSDRTHLRSNSKVIYALFNEVSTVKAVTIDAQTGEILANKKVNGFNNWGEMTRLFTYDESRNLFYYMEADYLSNKPPRTIYLYSVDPVTGTATKKAVSGATNFPSAFVYSCTLNTIILGTEILDNNNTRIGYAFYHVDPLTAAATKQAESRFQDQDDFAGWFHAVSLNGSDVYRQGFKNVVEESVPGLGVTSIASQSATTRWMNMQPIQSHDFYDTINVVNSGIFLSLAQQTVGNKSYDIVRWSLNTPARIVANLGNSHPVPFFGYVASQLTCDRSLLITATVEAHAPAILNDRCVIKPEHVFQLLFYLQDPSRGITSFEFVFFEQSCTKILETWANTMHPYFTGFLDTSSLSLTKLDIQPKLPAEEVSISGLGVPVSPQ